MPATRLLYAQIEEICRHFAEIRGEAANIVEANTMPDAALHLNDVLRETEEAAGLIVDAASEIGQISQEADIPLSAQQRILTLVTRILEASTFQDISGQRIKKVLMHLAELEEQLQRLSETARKQKAEKKPENTLLNGPQLNADAPTQDDVDKLFGA